MNNLVEQAKLKAKWNDELERRAEAVCALDFYNYRQIDYLAADIAARYPAENTDIQRYKFAAPLTQSLVRQVAVCFKESPTITLKDAPDTTQQAFTDLMDKTNIYKSLKQLDKYTELTAKVGALPRWNGSKVIIDIITPDKCYIYQDPDYPTEAIEVGYTIGQTADPNKAEQVNIYRVWTADTVEEWEINNNGLKLGAALKSEPNPYRRIPIAWFEIDQPLDSFWLDQGNPYVALNRRINLQLTNLDIAIDFQSFSTMVTLGLSDISVIPVGVTRRINIPAQQTSGEVQGDVKYVTPDAKLETVWKIIQESIQWFAGIMGISTESISEGSNFSSGFQLKLSKQGVIDRNTDKQDLYREAVRELCQLVMDTETLYGTLAFPTEASINIDFADIAVEVDPLQQEQIRAMKISNGTLDAVGCLMEDNPDLTEEEAIARIAEIKARRQQTLPPQAPSINNALGLNEGE